MTMRRSTRLRTFRSLHHECRAVNLPVSKIRQFVSFLSAFWRKKLADARLRVVYMGHEDVCMADDGILSESFAASSGAG